MVSASKLGCFRPQECDKIPGQPLYGFDEHGIHSQLVSVVELVTGEKLDVLVNDDGRPGAVDAVATIFTR